MKRINCVIVLIALFCLALVSCNQQPVEPVIGDQSLLKPGGIPADGNGNKIVVEFDESWEVDCGITANMVGWSQFKEFGPPNNRNIDITIFHLVITYTNDAGDKFVWHDVGPDHWYMVGDDLRVSMTGRSTGSGVIGHVVFSFAQWDFIHVAGYEFGDIDVLACETLN